MIPIYKINDTVEIDNTNKCVKIIDFEIFDNLILYYTDNKQAYPENMINHVGVNSLYNVFLVSDEERNKQYQEIKKKFNLY